MLFIKNLTNLSGSDIKITINKGDEISCSLSGLGTEQPVTLFKTEIQEILPNVLRSFNHITKATGVWEDSDDNVSSVLLDNRITKLAFFAKGMRTVFTETTNFPLTISKYDQEIMGDKRLPKDAILFIVPKQVDGSDVNFKVNIDKRNLCVPVLVEEVGDYKILGVFPKWMIWANLKFPAYICITNEDTDETIAAFKLGHTNKHNIVLNCVIDVDDVNEAAEYLKESARILEEKKRAPKKYVVNNTTNASGSNRPRNKYGNGNPRSNKNDAGHPTKNTYTKKNKSFNK